MEWTDKLVLFVLFMSMSEGGAMHLSPQNHITSPHSNKSLPLIAVFVTFIHYSFWRHYVLLLSRFTMYNQRLRTSFHDAQWRSPIAETLLFQSAERALIDVKSIHVATNEMEEILHLLTERDIEHTNNPPTLLCSFLRPPIFSISQTYTLRSNSVNISPSVSASLSVCVIMCTSTKPSCIQTDPSIYSQPARLSTCLLVNASLSYLSLSTSLAKPAKKLNTVYVLLRNYPFCKDVITLSSHYKQIWGLWTFEKTLNLCSNCSRNYKFHQLNIKLQAQAQQTFAKKPLLILRGWFYWRDANFV